MNKIWATKIDKGEMYVDLDEDTNLWCLFGINSGFAYECYSSKEEALQVLHQKNAE